MAVTVTMPQLGETVTEGTILRWAKQPGDPIEADEILLEVSTDKVDTEVPSPASGIVREILVPEGETVAVGTPLAVIAAADEAVAEEAPAPEEGTATEPATVAEERPPTEPGPEAVPAPEAPAAVAPVSGTEEIAGGPRRSVLSPIVRKLAAEHDVDLTRVPGTGDGGRITRKDVMAFVAAAAGAPAPEIPAEVAAGEVAASEAPAVPAPPMKVTFEPAVAAVPEAPEPETVEEIPAEPVAVPAAEVPEEAPAPEAEMPAAAAAVAAAAEEPAPETAPEPVPAAAVPEAPEAAPAATAPAGVVLGPGDQVIDLDRLRVRIAENMLHAKRSTAHVWTSVEVDYERVAQVRRRHGAAFKEQEGFSLTYLPFLARATVDALAAFPVVNSSFHLEEKQRVLHGRAHLGIAVDVNQQGLVVVTIRDADGLRLRGIARRVRDLAERARGGDLTPDDVVGSTFTITNPGPFGSFMSAPVINVPNSAILSTDTVAKRPTVLTLPDGTDTLGIHHIGYLGLTWDHRSFDGSTAVLFLQRIKENIETWDWERELA